MTSTHRAAATGSLEPATGSGEQVLTVEGLSVTFSTSRGTTHALRGVDLALRKGQIVGVAGESGSGKTTAALAATGLLARTAEVDGAIRYDGVDLVSLPEKKLRRYRGRHLAMIFQETGSALNPVIRVGDQLMMAARAHATKGADVRQRVTQALADVRLDDVDRVMRSYPHELSGGMCQRVIIAMALSCGSQVLFADEPTTALDVSVQREILDLIRGLVDQRGLAVMLISHDLAVLSEVCDDLVVMYRGQVVETGPAEAVLRDPGHPYTQALLGCIPTVGGSHEDLREITAEQRRLIESVDEPVVHGSGGGR
ncbi:MAG TPA: ABC transporter ATP-binding protein [Aeromicrobium sp.]|nr:ABC transporter ATP-binding protein [Aeromicrobium sp.]